MEAALTIAELREFASFSPAEQRYIERALDIGLGRCDVMVEWGGRQDAEDALRGHIAAYDRLDELRAAHPDTLALVGLDSFMGVLMQLTLFDLSQGAIESFSAYRFLYERLLGAEVRPWLPAAFCAASALPAIPNTLSMDMLQSLSEAAATAPGWSTQAPCFYPEWVEKEVA